MEKINFIKTKKDHFILEVNGLNLFGEQEKSFFRNLIQVIDNKL
jgi:hypothetical protein